MTKDTSKYQKQSKLTTETDRLDSDVSFLLS